MVSKRGAAPAPQQSVPMAAGKGATAEEQFGLLDAMSRLFDSLDFNQDGMLSCDELLDGLKQQGVGDKAIATLQKAIAALQQAIATDGGSWHSAPQNSLGSR